jgi:hypothetical protein
MIFLKRVITISLLLLFCLNIFGYRFVANYFANESSIALQVSLDQNKYDASELVSFKLPLNQPYIVNTDGYESVEGNMDYKGVNYQFVKKRICNDTLEIIGIPNTSKTKIENTKDDFAKQLIDISNTGSSKKSSTNVQFKFSVNDFIQAHYFDIYTSIGILKLKHESNYTMLSNFNYLQNIAKPPEA